MVEPPCLAEEILSALIVHLLRTGAVSEDDLLAMELSDDGKHHMNALIVESRAPPPGEWHAQRARRHIHIVEAEK